MILLVPAAGSATRLGSAILGSKELVEIGGEPVAVHLLRAAAAAGIVRAVVVLRRGKLDVEKRLGKEGSWGLALEFVTIEPTRSVPATVARGLERVPDPPSTDVALGFPDVIFTPPDALSNLVECFDRSPEVDVLLGLFPTDRPDKADMVSVAQDGRVLEIRVKPGACELSFTWLLALWRRRFSERLTAFVDRDEGPVDREPQLSDVLSRAIAEGYRVDGLTCPEGSHLDIGTPEDLARAQARRSS